MFNLLSKIKAEPVIKIRKNASVNHYRHKEKERRKAVLVIKNGQKNKG